MKTAFALILCAFRVTLLFFFADLITHQCFDAVDRLTRSTSGF